MASLFRSLWPRLTAAMAVAIVGCSLNAPEFYQVSGHVRFDGRPVVYGTVEFIPDLSKGHQGPPGSADIVDGVYDTSKAGGQGLSKGPHIARLTIFPEKLPPGNDNELVPTKAPAAIAIGFPVNVKVEGPTLDIDVPKSAKGFDMFKSKAPARRANEP